MRGVHQLPARSSGACVGQPLDRPLAGGGQAVVDLGGLLGDVDVHRPLAGAVRRSSAIDAGAGGAQRMDRDAGVQHAARHCAAPPRRSASTASASVAKRRWSSRSAGCVEAGALVQHRQQRQADAGSLRRRRPAPGTSSAGRRRACRPAGAAGSGIRTPACSRRAAVRRRACAADGAQLLGRDAQRDAVHAVAPGPEVVVRAARGARPGRRRRAGRRGCARSTRPGSTGPARRSRVRRRRDVRA